MLLNNNNKKSPYYAENAVNMAITNDELFSTMNSFKDIGISEYFHLL